MNKIETNMNMKTITITNDFVCYQQGGIGKEIIIAVDDLQQENKELKEKCEFEIKCNIEFADRINKAIEYINKNKNEVNKYQAKDTKLQVGTFMWNVDKLLEILKGE